MRATMHEIDVMRKFVGKHSAQCDSYDTNRDGFKDYYLPTERRIHRLDAIGRKTRSNTFGCEWLEFRCNIPGCDALMLVRMNDLREGEPIK